MLALLLAFAFQAFAVQTHLHGQPAGTVQQVQGDTPAKPLPSDPLDPATCKLCQELVHSTAVITPAAPELVLVLAWVAAFLPPAQLPALGLQPETGWQSRAPPQH
jgi:hypothetical protein